MVSSSNKGLVAGMKSRHEEQILGFRKEITALEGQVAKKDSDLKELLRKSNKKIDEGNSTILKLKSERDGLQKKCDSLEVEVNTGKVRLEAGEVEKNKATRGLQTQLDASEAKNRELMRIVTDLYDSSDRNGVELDRQSLDAYTRKWS